MMNLCRENSNEIKTNMSLSSVQLICFDCRMNRYEYNMTHTSPQLQRNTPSTVVVWCPIPISSSISRRHVCTIDLSPPSDTIPPGKHTCTKEERISRSIMIELIQLCTCLNEGKVLKILPHQDVHAAVGSFFQKECMELHLHYKEAKPRLPF